MIYSLFLSWVLLWSFATSNIVWVWSIFRFIPEHVLINALENLENLLSPANYGQLNKVPSWGLYPLLLEQSSEWLERLCSPPLCCHCGFNIPGQVLDNVNFNNWWCDSLVSFMICLINIIVQDNINWNMSYMSSIFSLFWFDIIDLDKYDDYVLHSEIKSRFNNIWSANDAMGNVGIHVLGCATLTFRFSVTVNITFFDESKSFLL